MRRDPAPTAKVPSLSRRNPLPLRRSADPAPIPSFKFNKTPMKSSTPRTCANNKNHEITEHDGDNSEAEHFEFMDEYIENKHSEYDDDSNLSSGYNDSYTNKSIPSSSIGTEKFLSTEERRESSSTGDADDI